MTEHQYQEGDVIEYQTFGGGYRTVVVTDREEDVKNGQPGFSGHAVGDHTATFWGYDHQLVRVIERASR